MASQWDNFLRNLGEWRGTFTSLDREARELESTASILTLEQGNEERLVHFRLRRYGPEGRSGEPLRDNREDYRSLGRQVVFFSTGTFCKGSLQVSPGTVFGGEFGFVAGDRRHRRPGPKGKGGGEEEVRTSHGCRHEPNGAAFRNHP